MAVALFKFVHTAKFNQPHELGKGKMMDRSGKCVMFKRN
jgi:hypothetical protein